MTKEEAQIIIKVNEKEVTDKIAKLEKRLESYKKKRDEANSSGDSASEAKWQKEIEKTEKQLANMRLEADKCRKTMEHLDKASPKELKRTIKEATAELNSGRVERGSKEWQTLTSYLGKAKAEMEAVRKEMGASTKAGSSWISKVKEWQVGIVGAVSMGAKAISKIQSMSAEYVDAYAAMQQEEANVRKYTGMTAEQVATLNEEFKKMDTRTSRQGLNLLAQEAGRLGKTSVEDVLGFVRAADQINVALDTLGDGATLTLSKLTSIFGDEAKLGTERSLLAVGSVINELSQNCSASAPYLTDFAQRLAGVGAQANMTVPQIMAYASVLDSNGQSVEKSATAMSTLINKLYTEPAKFAKAANIDVQKFTDTLKQDANQALLMFFESLSKLDGISDLSPILKELNMTGGGVSATMSVLAGNLDMVRSQIEAANTAYEEATSVSNEFAVQNGTVQASLDKTRKSMDELKVELGQQLLPVVDGCNTATRLGLELLVEAIKFAKDNIRVITALTIAIAAYTTAIKYKTIASKASLAIDVAQNAGYKAMRPLVLLLAAAKATLTGNTRKAATAMKLLGATMKGIPFVAIASAVTALITTLALWKKGTDSVAEAQKKLASIKAEAQTKAQSEIVSIRALVAEAEDENRSLEDRRKAIARLNEIIPNYNAQLDETTGKYTANKKAVDEYINSLIRQYEVEGAKSQLAELGGRKAELKTSKAKKKQELSELKDASAPANIYSAGSQYTSLSMVGNISSLKQDLSDIDKELEDIAKQEELIANIYREDIANFEIANIGNPDTGTLANNATSANDSYSIGKDRAEEVKARLEEEKRLIDQEQAMNAIAYATGEKNYEQYLARKSELDMTLLNNQIAALEEMGETDSNQYAKLLTDRIALQQKYAQDAKAKSLALIEAEYAEQKDLALSAYADIAGCEVDADKRYKQLLFQADVEYLKKKLELYKDNANERAKIERELNTLVRNDQISKEQESANKRKQFEQQYLNDQQASYKEALSKIDKMQSEGIISEAEASKARYQELSSYLKSIGQDFSASLLDMVSAIQFAFTGNGGAVDIITAGLATISAAMSQYSAFANAQRDLEIAKIEKQYDAEIKKAGNNKTKVAKLEEQKEAAVAKVKKKYNDKAMKIEIAQALAQTAQAAIAAYASAAAIPVTGWIMAPIAAGLATAAGMMQVATIKKQHEAEAAGYYEGGFTTNDPNKRKEVGVVHAGEFVMNHKAVNNPQLAPMLQLIDRAQKSNTVGTLTAADVSRSLGVSAGYGSASTATPGDSDSRLAESLSLVAKSIASNGSVITRLSDQISEGISANVSMDGDKGVAKQLERYNKLRSNPKR